MVELIIALLVLAIVMTALAPAYYGLLRAAATTSERSVANGLAVAATENIRAFPYQDIGYYQSVPSGSDCPGDPSQPADPSANPVILTSSTPLTLGKAPPKTVDNVAYTVQSCVNWVTASIKTDPSAYKQSVVTVSWTANGISGSLEQTSAIYPGGEGPYCPNQTCPASATTTTTTPSAPPSPPTNVTLSLGADPQNTIDISWTAPAGAPNTAQYYVYYTSNNPGSGDITTDGQPYTTSPLVTGTSTTITVGPNTRYYVEVATVVSNQTSSPSNPVVNIKTANSSTTTTTVVGSTTTVAPTTTTTLGPCQINSLSVSPPPGGDSSNNTDSQAVVALTASGNLADETSFTLSINASGNCTDVTVGYAPTGCHPGAASCPTTYAAMTGSGSTLYGTAGDAATVWNVPSLTFIVFTGATPTEYTPHTQKNITTCVEQGTTGTC